MRQFYRKYIYMPFVNLSFRSKLFMVFVLVTIIPMMLLVYFSYELTKTKLTEQIYINMTNSTAQITKNLENKLDSYEHISASIYLDNRLANYLTNEYQDDPSYLDVYNYIGNRIDTVMAAYPDFDSAFIYSDNPSLPKDNYYIRPITPEVQNTELFHKLKQSYGNIIHLSSPQTENSPAMFTLARLLNNNSNQYPYGMLVFQISESVIYSLMEKEAGGKDIFIINDKGIILSSADKQLINTSLPELLHQNFDETPSGRFDTTYQDVKALAVYNTLKNGWKTVSIFPYDSIIKDAKSLSQLIIKISLGFIGVALLLIYITASLFSKRIRTLIRMIRRIERGDFNPTHEEQMGNDEIGQLHFAFEQMTTRLKSLVTEVYQKELQSKEAELDLLQAQINPHFLYNTLGSISSLAVKHQDPQIQDMVLHLAKFYRISLNKGKSILTINEELKLTQSYNAIQLIRFKGKLNITYTIDQSILPYSTVKLALQPFVENAVIHALWNQDRPLNIHIKGVIENNSIILSVIDDGMGMRRETLQSLFEEKEGRGYGISNVDRRIKLKFGEYYGVKVYSKLGMGTTVQIRLPQKEIQ
ncbi:MULTISPECIES: sensor histidine kinase [unclassified Paenibacillus]|uniref:cache domain-containing sensor histidine kinase n=2 Tax=unclassified Paenibacillus TaxID=185978 RepID=UPI00088F4F68|nr:MULTISPECIES: sensor histidine kinase [unclassified Paenibacillus]SEA19457.1 two-component system, sensor histidine kinase YesM [Paenibacillus sp. 276b]SOC70285.1 two-component system, sensor histidine kinase YesM [Paenibacillus sp. RU5M]SDJ90352.1 two-component system, sensor histidine kinase YesM [Paenibacillus sp. OK060]SHN52068.1 two-component system, sensor histidine kinase YesM [Paenibacillus sp. ov031]SLJ99099.1 two-component system, sensor histidine kinase YesM [Paenibacillus sp. RU